MHRRRLMELPVPATTPAHCRPPRAPAPPTEDAPSADDSSVHKVQEVAAGDGRSVGAGVGGTGVGGTGVGAGEGAAEGALVASGAQ